MIRIILAFILIFLFRAYLDAQGSDAITGIWITQEDKAIVQIEKINGSYAGKILKIHPRGYINGNAPKDEKNVNAHLRSRSMEGITTLSGITYNSKKELWQVSQLYDPERGKYYEGYISLQGPNTLKLRGHLPGKKWLGITEIWKRTEDANFTPIQGTE
jgi:uncharacterized protein (DUF2147 family)